jgi:hypothetical protein
MNENYFEFRKSMPRVQVMYHMDNFKLKINKPNKVHYQYSAKENLTYKSFIKNSQAYLFCGENEFVGSRYKSRISEI